MSGRGDSPHKKGEGSDAGPSKGKGKETEDQFLYRDNNEITPVDRETATAHMKEVLAKGTGRRKRKQTVARVSNILSRGIDRREVTAGLRQEAVSKINEADEVREQTGQPEGVYLNTVNAISARYKALEAQRKVEDSEKNQKDLSRGEN